MKDPNLNPLDVKVGDRVSLHAHPSTTGVVALLMAGGAVIKWDDGTRSPLLGWPTLRWLLRGEK